MDNHHHHHNNNSSNNMYPSDDSIDRNRKTAHGKKSTPGANTGRWSNEEHLRVSRSSLTTRHCCFASVVSTLSHRRSMFRPPRLPLQFLSGLEKFGYVRFAKRQNGRGHFWGSRCIMVLLFLTHTHTYVFVIHSFLPALFHDNYSVPATGRRSPNSWVPVAVRRYGRTPRSISCRCKSRR